MSKDFSLAHPCPHLILEEVVALGSDRRSLVAKAPVASSNVVRVLSNDELYIPSGGLFSQAQVGSAAPGPFRVSKCDRTLTVSGSAESVSIEVPVGSRVTAEVVAKQLRGVLSTVVVEVVRGGLVFTDTANLGPESSVVVGGSAATSLGFGTQRGARGRKVFPSWRLASSPSSVTGRYVQFTDQVRQNPMFKLTYVASAQYCPRCAGTYIENDVRYDLQGDAVLIQDENLLYQAALKVILTQVRSNPFHPSYGSTVTSRIGSKAVGAVATLITEDVQTALSKLQESQKAQAKFQVVSAKERLYAVTSVRVSPSATDPTVFMLDVGVRNASNDPVSITIVFSVPGVVALTGSNGLSLGLETTGLTTTQAASAFR